MSDPLIIDTPKPDPPPLRAIRIEANITQRCNARCWGCNKAVGVADGALKDMTVEQIAKAVDQLLEQEIECRRFTFCGGEPCLHTGLQDMIYEVARLNPMRRGHIRILTNGMPVTEKIRERIILPDKRFVWIHNPLDDPYDPYSGKNISSKRPNRRVHQPFWISPADIGIEAKYDDCTVKGWCGVGLDAEGWSMCGKATLMGKLLGIDPTLREGDIFTHVHTGIEEICKHCQYGLTKKVEKSIYYGHREGKYADQGVDDEGISPTWRRAFDRFNEDKVPLVQIEML